MIKVIAVGQIKEKALISLITDYLKRISHFSKIEIIEVSDFSKAKDIDYSIDKESELILKTVKTENFVVLLDLQGEPLNSLKLAHKLQQWLTHYSDIIFVIGGSDGVNNKVKERANFSLQLSELTFPHQIVRLILLEQLYRSFKIINNQSYHK